jgi:3',5'-cyclic-AMP phosphodiesterase
VVQFGQHPRPRHTVAHLSDPHLLAAGARQYGVIDPEAGLLLALDRLRRLDPAPDVIAFTGDLADKAEPAAYARLRELVEPVAAELGAQVVWTMGNHDERRPYAEGMFDSHDDGPQDRCHDVRGLRVIALDTSVPGYHHGDLTDDQLGWLAEQLATPAEHGTVLALHHPPIPVPMLRAAEIIELLDQHRLAEVVRGSDVRVVVGGHFHYTSWSTFAGVPVSVASASCYTADPAPLDRLISGVDGHQSFTVLHLYGEEADRQVVHTVVPLAQAFEVSGHPADVVAQLEALSAEERREIVSNKASELNQG